jgi:hypothetical protein
MRLRIVALACLIGAALPGPTTAHDPSGEDSRGVWQINQAAQDGGGTLASAPTVLRTPLVDTPGPRALRAIPTIAHSGDAPCCSNNLKKFELGVHNYNDAPGAGALARPVTPPAAGSGYVLTTPVHAARTPVSPVLTYSLTTAWPTKGGVERRLANPQQLPTAPATPAGPQR